MMWQAMRELIGDVHLLYPGWLWVWPLSVAALALWLRTGRLFPLSRVPSGATAKAFRHPRLATLRRLFGADAPRGGRRDSLRTLLAYAVLLLCVLAALAHPYRLGEELPTPPEYRDTVFVIDTSISMSLRDYIVDEERVERMTILKDVLARFVEQLGGNRISLIPFSTQPYTLVPLTADKQLLASMIERLEPALLTGRTTDVGTAMLYTLQQLEQPAVDEPDVHKPAIVLVTDVNRSPRDIDPRAIATHLSDRGFRLHTIGIGAGTREAREEAPSGLVYQPANFRLLKEIAEAGGGRFYWADSVESLREAVAAIQSGERRPIDAEPRHVTIALYQWPLAAGLLWLMAAQLLPRRRRQQA